MTEVTVSAGPSTSIAHSLAMAECGDGDLAPPADSSVGDSDSLHEDDEESQHSNMEEDVSSQNTEKEQLETLEVNYSNGKEDQTDDVNVADAPPKGDDGVTSPEDEEDLSSPEDFIDLEDSDSDSDQDADHDTDTEHLEDSTVTIIKPSSAQNKEALPG